MRKKLCAFLSLLLCLVLMLGMFSACENVFETGTDTEDPDDSEIIRPTTEQWTEFVTDNPDLSGETHDNTGFTYDEEGTDTPTGGSGSSGQTNTHTDTRTTNTNTDTNNTGTYTYHRTDTDTRDTGDTSTPSNPPDYGILSNVSYDGVVTGRTKNSSFLKSMTVNGMQCYYDSNNKLFILSIPEADVGQTRVYKFSGVASDGSTKVHFAFRDNAIPASSKLRAKATQTLRFRAYSDKEFGEYDLRISVVPILSIDTQNAAAVTSKTTAILCQVMVQDPDYAAHGSKANFSSYATIHVRGASSAGYEKKPYKVELFSETSYNNKPFVNKRNASLLGMRKDDDWTLDALYLDNTLTHNYMAYNLWQEMGGDTNPYGITNGPRCKYCEVYLNGKYNGAYLLVEPVDEKQAGVEKKENTPDGTYGVIYKSTSWDNTKFDKYPSSDPKANVGPWGGFTMKYPETNVKASDWDPLKRLLKSTTTGSDSDFKSTAKSMLDKKNIVNYWIFISVTLARDNAGKNIVYSIANISKSNYKMYINVWDCDNSFGYRYGNPHAVKDSATKPDSCPKYFNYADDWFYLLRRYLTLNVDGGADYLKTRWAELTKTGGLCSEAALDARITAAFAYVRDSGLFEREYGRWPKSVALEGLNNPMDPLTDVYARIDEEEAYAIQWMHERLPVVDNLVKNVY